MCTQDSNCKIYANAISCSLFMLYNVYFVHKFFLVGTLKSYVEFRGCQCAYVKTHHSHHGQVLNPIESKISFFRNSKKKFTISFSYIQKNSLICAKLVGRYVNVIFKILDAFRTRDFPRSMNQIILKLLHSHLCSFKVFHRWITNTMLFILFCNCSLWLPYNFNVVEYNLIASLRKKNGFKKGPQICPCLFHPKKPTCKM